MGRTFILRDTRGNPQAWRDSATGGQQHRLLEVPRNAGKHRSVITQDPDQSLPRHFYMDIPEFDRSHSTQWPTRAAMTYQTQV